MTLRKIFLTGVLVSLLPSLAMAATMTKLPINGDANQVYFTDGTGMFYKMGDGKLGPHYVKLPGARKNSFRFVAGQGAAGAYVQDNRFVYYYYKKIPRADPKTFEVMDGTYARDYRSIFHGTRRLRVTHADFHVLGDLYATDGRTVYHDGTLLAGADAKTFELTGNFCAKDARNTYCWGQVSRIAKPESFEQLDMGISKDSKRVFCSGDTYTRFDAPTFTALSTFYAKDKHSAYWMTITPSKCTFEPIPEADPSTFTAVVRDGTMYMNYALDANHVYFDGKILAGADPKTFDPRQR